jgi:transcriptional regulator with PAS, ATPase and Fis domain
MRPIDQRDPAGALTSGQGALLLDPLTPASQAAQSWRECFPEIIGRCPTMQRVLEIVHKGARSDSSVLILGESGTGKELIAAAVHRISARSAKPFVAINCSAIPDNLLESELFGHERGAFTGADKKKIGKFEYARGGTIFLDEIGDMAPALQAKLLRVLQQKAFVPLGGNELVETDVRIVAATNVNLETAIKEGRFRQDLYYRLNVFPVRLPALRDRAEDIDALIAHYLETYNRIHAVENPCWFTDELIATLTKLPWPGNIRQLQNVIERLVVTKGGGKVDVSDVSVDELDQEIGAADPASPAFPRAAMRAQAAMPLPRPRSPMVRAPEALGTLPSEGVDLPRFIETLENDLIRQALERTGNNRNQAAKLLGLNRTTLVERIKKRKLAALNDPPKEL